jgi:predicted transcriptional regulator
MFNVRVNEFGTSSVANFSMKFANGYTVSLAMGDGIYSNGNMEDGFSAIEVAAWDADGKWIKLSDNDDVIGWQSAEEVLAIMNKVASYTAGSSELDTLRELRAEITRINEAAGETRFNPTATSMLDRLIDQKVS